MFEDLDDPAVRAFWALMEDDLERPVEDFHDDCGDIEPGLRDALKPGEEKGTKIMPISKTKKLLKECEQVDMIAAGYEWNCPRCHTFHRMYETKTVVVCSKCNRVFKTNPPEHAYGK